jgi:hypothetical protein
MFLPINYDVNPTIKDEIDFLKNRIKELNEKLIEANSLIKKLKCCRNCKHFNETKFIRGYSNTCNLEEEISKECYENDKKNWKYMFE